MNQDDEIQNINVAPLQHLKVPGTYKVQKDNDAEAIKIIKQMPSDITIKMPIVPQNALVEKRKLKLINKENNYELYYTHNGYVITIL